jgi:hypothetical protein
MRSRPFLIASAFTALAMAIAVVLVVTSSAEEPAPVVVEEPPEPSPEPEPTCPLTGDDFPERMRPNRPAVAVKVGNSPAARPQYGLEAADVVFEEVVEGGITRFLALYHCDDARQVGPVRSARYDDPKIAKPFTRILAYSGANAIVEAELRAQDMVALDEDSGAAFYRVPAGVFTVHNLFTDTEAVRRLVSGRRVAPPSDEVFEFGELPEDSGRARWVRMNFTPGNTIEYRWQDGAWRRYEGGRPFMTAGGEQIAVPNVLVQEVEVNHSNRIRDSAGNPSPDITLRGSGRALLFRDGRLVRGRWTKRGRDPAPSYSTRDGEPMVFAEGPVWVQLVPSPRGSVKGAIDFGRRFRD